MTALGTQADPTNGVPSRTTTLVAAAQAFGSRDPDEGVRNPDYVADKLIGSEELALDPGPLVGRRPGAGLLGSRSESDVPTLTGMMILRTRFIDQALKRAVENGAQQIVILGAGFDSRPYRCEELLKDCHVIEAGA